MIDDPFVALVNGFCHLVVPAKRGADNWHRLIDLNGKRIPTASDIVEMPIEKLQQCIAVKTHARYLQDIALQVFEHPEQLEGLAELSNKDLAERLQTFKGVGPWLTGWMKMYHLGRPDVLLEGDASLVRAVRRQYQLAQRPSTADLQHLAENWNDHVSAACWFIFMADEKLQQISAST